MIANSICCTPHADEDGEEGGQAWTSSEEEEGGRGSGRRHQPPFKRSSTAVVQQHLCNQRQQQEEQERLELSRMPPPTSIPLPPFSLPNLIPSQLQHQQHGQPAPAHTAGLPTLSDITNLSHLAQLEPSATIKLCMPKHDMPKGFSFLHDLAPPPHLQPPNHQHAHPMQLGSVTCQGQQEHPKSEDAGLGSGVQAHTQQQQQQQQQQQGEPGVLPTPLPRGKTNTPFLSPSRPQGGFLWEDMLQPSLQL